MPWNNQTGGPWQPRNPGPWGQGPQGGGKPPDIEEILRKGQDRLRRVMPGGGGGMHVGLIGVVILALAAFAAWMFFGIYTVRPNEVGIERVFGRYVATTAPGLNWNWPLPIGRVDKPTISVQTVEIGMRRGDGRRTGGVRDVREESLMLTGDENIVDVDFSVLWAVDPAKPQDFVFNIKDPEVTVKAVSESAMREILGRRDIQPILTGARLQIESEVQKLIQKTLNDYGAGIVIQQVQMQKVDPPQEVIDAFRDVQAARADQERAQNEAQSYAKRVVPEARGEATRIEQRAEAESERLVADAQGEAVRFNRIYDEYNKAPDVTRQRLYLETIERVFGGMDKIIIDQSASGQGVQPYLPLTELTRPRAPANGTAPAQQGGTR